MTEVTGTGEDHGDAMFISCRNDFIITHTSSGLDSAACTTIDNDI
jgi:hypothetical protein